ncbi:MAG: 30S ribosomal protein S8 [Patescibacteria group bacterium]|nr:30S ribosomal protein S8 [Patescibacteria group bacterium]
MNKDTISNFLSQIKNAYMRGKTNIEVPNSSAVKELCTVLKKLEFINDFKVFKKEKEKFKYLNVELSYANDKPAVMGLRRVSKSGRRVYVGYKDIRQVLGGLGVSVISTSRGLMSNLEARKRKLGGEIICEIW